MIVADSVGIYLYSILACKTAELEPWQVRASFGSYNERITRVAGVQGSPSAMQLGRACHTWCESPPAYDGAVWKTLPPTLLCLLMQCTLLWGRPFAEDEPDLVIQIPKSKVKLVVGPNGTTIGTIQRKSKARVQIKRDEEELNRAWGSGPTLPAKLPAHVGHRRWCMRKYHMRMPAVHELNRCGGMAVCAWSFWLAADMKHFFKQHN